MKGSAPRGAGSDTDHIRVWRRNLWPDGDAKLDQVSSTFFLPVILEVRLLAVALSIELTILVIDSQPDSSNTGTPNIRKVVLDGSLSTAGFLVSDISPLFAEWFPELLDKLLPSSVRFFREYLVQIMRREFPYTYDFCCYKPVRILFRVFDQPWEVRV